jgi:DNA-binding beta-propeller fold protein YncE
MSPTSALAFVALEATGQVLKFDAQARVQLGSASVGPNPRHLSIRADSTNVYVSRFITPPLPGEGTGTITTSSSTGGEVVVLDAATMSVVRTIVLQHGDKADLENQGRGIPNYLGAAAISPDGSQAWVPSKQDNVKRGTLRDGNALNFQNTVRAISSRIVLGTGEEDRARRIDHDNASVASAAVYDTRGVYLFVALETSREVAVIDAHGGYQVMRFVSAGRRRD